MTETCTECGHEPLSCEAGDGTVCPYEPNDMEFFDKARHRVYDPACGLTHPHSRTAKCPGGN